ncbi:MAG TPA: methyltransferase domain-containing protein [Pyrinomonadaceae bacterium]|nr:methyltransferase domain-containing protein [Pyrinomonadaceae bacterium]
MSLKDRAKQSKNALILFAAYQNWRMKRRFRSGNPSSSLGSTHSRKNLSQSLSYIDTQFNDYLFHLGIQPGELAGKRVLEVGFGDNIGVGLRFIAAGAAFVACIDKFYASRNREQEREIYEALRDTLDDASKARFDDAIELTGTLPLNSERIKCVYGVDVANAEQLGQEKPFDLVVSRAVLQQIYDPDETIEGMDRLLAPGGFMLHKIDLSDQGMFRDRGMHPLTFLTIPEWQYRLMAEGSGRSNRKLLNYYKQKLEALGYEVKVLVTDIIGRSGKGDLAPVEFDALDHLDEPIALLGGIRQQLAPEFRKLSDRELIIDGIFVVARKAHPQITQIC